MTVNSSNKKFSTCCKSGDLNQCTPQPCADSGPSSEARPSRVVQGQGAARLQQPCVSVCLSLSPISSQMSRQALSTPGMPFILPNSAHSPLSNLKTSDSRTHSGPCDVPLIDAVEEISSANSRAATALPAIGGRPKASDRPPVSWA